MGPIASLSDEAVLQTALEGSQAAWTELVDRYHPRGFRYVRGAISDPHLAHDIMQSLWISLVQAVNREAPAQFNALFWTLLKRRVIDELRRKGRSKEAATLDAPFEVGQAGGDSLLDLQTSSAPDPADAALQAEEQSLLQRALEQLPDHYRLVIIARQLQGRSNRETAAMLITAGLVTDDGNVEKRVENYYYRGLKELKRQLVDLGFSRGGAAS